MDFSILLPYISVIIALALLWPRGYLLIYLIDRTKSFRFGFKFFVGFILGASGFTIDLFAAHVVGSQPLAWWVIIGSAVSQIFGFSFVIFLFERRLVLPHLSRGIPFIKKTLKKIWNFNIFEKTALTLIVISFVVVGMFSYRISLDQQYADIPALIIYENDSIPSDENTLPLPGGIQSYPLNDTIMKVYISKAAGIFSLKYVGIVNLFYGLILFGAFYFMLPIQLPRLLRLGSLLVLLICQTVMWWSGGVFSTDVLYSLFLLLTVACLFYYLAGAGLSFFYLALMAMAFALWSNGAGLLFAFPTILIATIVMALTRRVPWRHFGLSWFFAVLTLVPWLIVNRNIVRLITEIPPLYRHLLTSRGWELFGQAFVTHALGIVWFVVLAFILLWYKKIWRQYPLLFLTIIALVLRIAAAPQALIDEPEFFGRLVSQLNAWFIPLAVFTITFYFHDLFGRMQWYGKKI